MSKICLIKVVLLFRLSFWTNDVHLKVVWPITQEAEGSTECDKLFSFICSKYVNNISEFHLH